MKKIILSFILLIFLVSCGTSNDTTPSVSSGGINETTNDAGVIQDATTSSQTTQLKTFTMSDVEQHSSQDSCYTVIDLKVYDITSFFGKHPGGDDKLLGLCGIDGTESFNRKHGENDKAIMTRDEYYIGDLTQ